jgi:hypothetical protein
LGVIFGGGLFNLSAPLVKVTGGISLLLESEDGLSFVRSPSDMMDSSSVYQIHVYYQICYLVSPRCQVNIER